MDESGTNHEPAYGPLPRSIKGGMTEFLNCSVSIRSQRCAALGATRPNSGAVKRVTHPLVIRLPFPIASAGTDRHLATRSFLADPLEDLGVLGVAG